jgi:hypothetical protein
MHHDEDKKKKLRVPNGRKESPQLGFLGFLGFRVFLLVLKQGKRGLATFVATFGV